MEFSFATAFLSSIRTALAVAQHRAAVAYTVRIAHEDESHVGSSSRQRWLTSLAEYTTVVGGFIEPAFSECVLWTSAMAAMAIVPLAIGVEWKYGDWREDAAAAEEGAAEADTEGEPEQKTVEQAATEDLVMEIAGNTE